MNKNLTVILIIIAALVFAGIFYFITKDGESQPNGDFSSGNIQQNQNVFNATYVINGQKVELVDGRAEQEATPGSATKITTTIFGEPVYGDLDDDGDQDAALMLVQNPGGSGTFYYAAVALNENEQYQGRNAVLLGDRVAPQNIAIEGSVVVANYARRRPDEPMSARPSVGVSKYLIIEKGELVDMTDNQATCEKTGRLGIDSIPGGDFREINEFGSAGSAVFSGAIVAREFPFYNETFTAVYIVIMPPSSEGSTSQSPFEGLSPQAKFYSYFTNMVDFGNTINDKQGQNLLFKVGLFEDGRISSTANISSLAEAMMLAALGTNGGATLKIEVPVYLGAGAPENFSFACAVSVPG